MSASPETLAKLRHQLAARFPTATRTVGRMLATGIPAIDDAAGGLPLSAITEIVCATSSCGGHLALAQLLALSRRASQRVALIDSHDSFDPSSYLADDLAHLIWVRCTGTSMALQAADLLVRDANLGLVVLDVRAAAEVDLRRIPGPQWYRLQRAVEPTDLAFVIETPRASVPSAQLRFALTGAHDFSTLERERPALTTQLAPTLQRQRVQTASAG